MAQVVFFTGIKTPMHARLARFFTDAGDKVLAAGAPYTGVDAAFIPWEPLTADAGKKLFDACAILTDHIDLFIDTSDEHFADEDKKITDGLNAEAIVMSFRANTLVPLQALEALLPLMDAGEGKRCAFFSNREACVNHRDIDCGFGPGMAKGALHNILQCVKNRLEGDGYTFRVYDPMTGEVDDNASAGAAYVYFTRRRGRDPFNASDRRNDEKNLVLRDALGRVWPW